MTLYRPFVLGLIHIFGTFFTVYVANILFDLNVIQWANVCKILPAYSSSNQITFFAFFIKETYNQFWEKTTLNCTWI